MAEHRSRDVGLLGRACPRCYAVGVLRVREVQEMRSWGPVRRRHREPYRMATCASCGTRFPVRSTDELEP